MKILIIRFSSLGDIVLTTHLPRLIKNRFSNAEIDMVVKDEYLDLIKFNPHISEKISFNTKHGFWGIVKLAFKLKNEKYDFILDLHSSFRSFIIDFVNWSVPKLYYCKKSFKRFLLIYTKINLFSNSESKINDYLKPLKKFLVKNDNKGTELFIDDKTTEKVAKLLDKKEKKLIGLVPGAKWKGKKWGKYKFQELCQLIIDKTDFHVVLIGSKQDENYIDIQNINKNRIKSFIGKFSILESASLLSFCDLVISNDTGMMHVAEAVGTDVICIMGATTRDFGFSPYRKNSQVIDTRLWCRPCSKKGDGFCYRKQKYLCLKKVSSLDVFNKIKEYFKI